MIFLSRTTADSAGQIILRNYQLSGDYENTARISRDKTLDGGSVFSHYGVTDTDRTFLIECRLSTPEAVALKAYFENAVVLRISFWEGSFSGYIYRLSIRRDGTAKITFYFSEKLT
jgi:hypothetical protein